MDINPTSVSEPALCRVQAAEDAGLLYVSGAEPGISRRKSEKGFAYRGPEGRRIANKAALRRIRALAIPPAWTEVWICLDASGHIQATGRDARGRKQYRYHPDFRALRDESKYQRVMGFAELLPAIRAKVARHMGLPGLPREKVLATVVHLLETTLIRIGNADYARQNQSFGLTTLRDPHVKVSGSELLFQFKGKSGKEWRLKVANRRVAKIVKSCQDLPGQHLFQYLDENGERQNVGSADVNAYLREIAGAEVTAKDFRTWAGTVLAALALQEFEAFDSQAMAKKNVRAAIETVAARLGNTPTICRKCYIHPEILNCYLDGSLLVNLRETAEAELREGVEGLKPEEGVVLAFLRTRLSEAEKGCSP